MLVSTSQQRHTRSGATAVELAAVVAVFVLLFFGIMEYCLMIFAQQVVEAATREGARYAVVNSTNPTLVSDTQAVVKNFMSGLDKRYPNYNCNVYLADANGNNIGTPANAAFGQYICVDVTLDYVPVSPVLVRLGTFTIHSKCAMGSEAN